MATFHFELVSPEKLLYSGDVEAVIVPGVEGQFTVLKDHAPVMSVLKAGIVEIDESANKRTKLFVLGGFADVNSRGLTILAQLAKPLEEFGSVQLAQEIKDAEEDLADAKTEAAKKLAAEKLAELNELNELKSALSI